ncbi:MAG TPA: YdiU family protein [Methylomirabilota bacterium]|nr:YdiU family protein [Methylomirabilota bacterium]
MNTPIAFDNTYARLPDRFHARVAPDPVRAPKLVRLNLDLARDLRLDADWLASPDGLAVLAGNRVPTGAEPIAMAYAGHQFGQFVPQLGDGRAILLGEVIDRNGHRRDIQLKGSGPTPFSRRGDGRAALGPVLREYVVSEAMAALGIPTTRALAAVTTGEEVVREAFLPGAIFARVAASHVRVGTFQYFAARGDVEALRTLADYVIERTYPDIAGADRPFTVLLERICDRQADLVAAWMAVGFIHGVMNTDNMSVAGETIDYGPCAFMDAYHPAKVFSSIDQQGRYAFANQPRIAHWNLVRLAEAMLPIFDADEDTAVAEAQRALSGFAPRFEAAFLNGMRGKLGLFAEDEEDPALARDLLAVMAAGGADFTLFFRSLADAVSPSGASAARSLFADPAAFDAWAARWRARLDRDRAMEPERRAAAMRAVNPAYIPRNHQIEAAIRAAVDDDDLGPFEALLAVLSRPFEDQPGQERFAAPPGPKEEVLQTFCGT